VAEPFPADDLRPVEALVARTTSHAALDPTHSQAASPPAAEPGGANKTSAVGLGTWLAALVVVAAAIGFAVRLNMPPGERDLIERDRTALVGRWRNEAGLEIEFLPDGKLREKRLFDTGNGTYELLPGRKLRMRTEGMFGGALPTGGEGLVRYQLTEKELAITSDSGLGLAIRYERVTP
jgi:hypothetical protein